MKTLAEFDTLEAAKEYTQTQGKMIHRNTMNLLLAQNERYITLKDIADNPLHPMRELVAAFMDSTEYNLIQTSTAGQAVINLMKTLIAAEDGDANLQAVLDTAMALANETYYPHANATEYDWKREKGLPIKQKEVTPINGYIKITLTKGVEAHRPQVYADIQGVKQRVTGFGLVSKAGDYLAEVPRGYAIFYVDDAYGAM